MNNENHKTLANLSHIEGLADLVKALNFDHTDATGEGFKGSCQVTPDTFEMQSIYWGRGVGYCLEETLFIRVGDDGSIFARVCKEDHGQQTITLPATVRFENVLKEMVARSANEKMSCLPKMGGESDVSAFGLFEGLEHLHMCAMHNAI